MANLDDKLLGEKLEYYCSSDEGEDDTDQYYSGDENAESRNEETTAAAANFRPNPNETSNTGPKGVIKDFQRFKQLESEKREEQNKERIALAQKLSMTCSGTNEEVDPELADILSDDFLLEFAQKRMHEMLINSTTKSTFGQVHNIKSSSEYLDAIDKEDKKVTVIFHVYEDRVSSCRTMNACFEELCQSYKKIKFCKLPASCVGLSRQFKMDGVPAILVYKAGELIGNFVQLGEEFGNEFSANDIENFLIEKGIALDNPAVSFQ